MALYNPLSIIVSPIYLYLFFLKTFSYKFANFSHSKEEEEVSHTMGKNNREAKEKKGQPEPLSGSHKVKKP